MKVICFELFILSPIHYLEPFVYYKHQCKAKEKAISDVNGELIIYYSFFCFYFNMMMVVLAMHTM